MKTGMSKHDGPFRDRSFMYVPYQVGPAGKVSFLGNGFFFLLRTHELQTAKHVDSGILMDTARPARIKSQY